MRSLSAASGSMRSLLQNNNRPRSQDISKGALRALGYRCQKVACMTTSTRPPSQPTPNTPAPHTYIPSLVSVPLAKYKPSGWAPTVVHPIPSLSPIQPASTSPSTVKVNLIRVRPGGEVPHHFHSLVWDYFVALQGEAVIEAVSEDGGERAEYSMRGGGGAGPEYPLSSGSYSFLALAPGVRHRVRNVREEGEFVFLLTQGPLDGYDFIAA